MRTNRYFFLFLLVSLYTNPADAMFVGPTYAPVDRLIANTTAFVKENPRNAHGYYTLARIHYLAFVNKASVVGVTNEDSPPRIASDWLLGDFTFRMRWERALELTLAQYGYSSRSDIPNKERRKFNKAVQKKEQQLEKEGWRFERLKDQECVNHAANAMRNFRKAISLKQDNGLYHLGLACLLEQYVQFLRDIKLDQVPEEFRSIILNRSKDIYYKAYTLSIRNELKLKHMPLAGFRSLV